MQRAFLDIQRNLAKRYVFARLTQIINEKSRRTDLIFKQDRNSRFIILCPETDLSHSTTLAQRIQSASRDSMGVSVAWGMASFPDEAVTFADLLQKAELKLLKTAALPFPLAEGVTAAPKLVRTAMTMTRHEDVSVSIAGNHAWREKFAPERRLLRGQAYLAAKRVMDISLVILSLPLCCLLSD